VKTDMTGDQKQVSLSDFGEDELIPSGTMPAIFPRTNPQTWAALRHKGNGPAFVKVMRRVYYRRCDVEAWIHSNVYTRTDRPVV
jgi:hypothetical protein